MADAVALSLSERIARGIYVDLSGWPKAVPVVLCTAVGEVVEQVVTDSEFGDAALAKDLRVADYETQIEAILTRADDEDRQIFTFTTDLLDTVEDNTRHTQRLAPRHVEAQSLLRDWFPDDQRAPSRRQQSELADYLHRIGSPLPPYLGRRQTTQRLRYVQQQLRKHGDYSAITGTAKAKWTKVLQSNRHDCCGLRRLMIEAVLRSS